MKMPPFLLGSALIFWGWQTGFWIFALPMALIFEGSRLINWRWELSSGDFIRISNLCLSLLVILLIYLFFVSAHSIYFVYTLLQWLPIVFFPLLAAQGYSTRADLDIRTMFLFLAHKNQGEKTLLNFKYPYIVICILSASAANTRNISFYLGMFMLTSIMLWVVRSKRFSPLIWLCLIIMAGSMGIAGHLGLYNLQLILEQNAVEWLSGFYQQDANPFQRYTAIGDIGLLKLDNGILFRVAADEQETVPGLLRESTYNKYKSSLWVASNPEFTAVLPDISGTTWQWGQPPAHYSEIKVSARLHEGKGLLKLPDGTFQVSQLPVLSMEKNKYGTVKVEGETNFVSYQLQFNNSLAVESSPTEEDLQVPDSEKLALRQILNQLDLKDKSSREILKQIESFFAKNFSYSLELAGKNNQGTPLSNFLGKNRSGHCEYFATATTLLLREAGIPARYAIGYSVHEFSPLENQFIVRGRHAHAWTLVYIDGAWQNFDTTPASWTSIEDAAASPWGWIADLWSWLVFKLCGGLGQIKESGVLKHWWWLTIPFILVLRRQFNSKKRIRRLNSKAKAMRKSIFEDSFPRDDSEFSLIEKTLNESGFTRNPSETLKNWIERLADDLPRDGMEDLKSILELHYLYCFDPQGITATERMRLKSSIQSWLVKYKSEWHNVIKRNNS
jgi:hypothetical protein